MNPRVFNPFPVITTERLTLRSLSVEDAESIFKLRSDAEINKYLDRQPSTSIEDAYNFIGKISEGVHANTFIYWVVTLTESKTFLGTICLFSFSDNNDQCEIGFELSTSYQRQGIMKEAANAVIDYVFKVLQIKKIEAITHKNNLSSIKLLEALHFKSDSSIPKDNPDCITYTLMSSVGKS
jgi:ribosomal-protein-alanine N-acetyltransferase